MKLTARNTIQRYVDLKYTRDYSVEKVKYNFETQTYTSAVLDNKKKWCTEIEYYKNGVNRIGKREILDRKER